MKTLLVAVMRDDREQAAAIAANEFQVHVATSVKEALPMLDLTDLDGIVVGVHFNDGDLFEFLELVNMHRLAAALPFIVVRAAQGRLRDGSYRVVEAACKQKDVPYIDATELVARLGGLAGHAELRKRIRKLLPMLSAAKDSALNSWAN